MLSSYAGMSAHGDVSASHVRSSADVHADAVLPAAVMRNGLLSSGYGLWHGHDACTGGLWQTASHDEAHGEEQQENATQAAPGRAG